MTSPWTERELYILRRLNYLMNLPWGGRSQEAEIKKLKEELQRGPNAK